MAAETEKEEPLLNTLALADLAILGGYFAAVVLVGLVYLSQHSLDEFCLAGRRLRDWQVGLSLTATLVTTVTFTDAPGDAYQQGLRAAVLMPLALLITIPFAAWVGADYRRRGYQSIYELFGERFDGATRRLATGWFVAWRFVWLVAVLHTCGLVMQTAADVDGAEWALILVLGLSTTLYTFLGGMRAVVWTDLLQIVVIAAGVLVIVLVGWWRIDGGWSTIARSLADSDRLTLHPQGDSSFWLHLLTLAGALLSYYAADQIVGQRFLSAESPTEARRAAWWHGGSAALIFAGLGTAGLILYAFYQAHPERMRPEWVLGFDQQQAENLDETAPIGSQYRQRLTPKILRSLALEGKILDPATGSRLSNPDDVIDSETGLARIERFAARRTHASGVEEIVIQRSWLHQLLPVFVSQEIPWGLRGIVLTAIMAAAMSTLDASLNSLATALVVERRLWRHRKQTVLQAADDLRAVQSLTVVLGMIAMGCSLLLVRLPGASPVFEFIVAVAGAPLLALWLVAHFVPACDGRSARFALFTGVGILAALIVPNLGTLADGRLIWPLPMNALWLLPLATVGAVAAGALSAWLLAGRELPSEPAQPRNNHQK